MTTFLSSTESALDARARRAARAAGYTARKSRHRVGSIDNFSGFAIIDPDLNFVVVGQRFDMTAQEVIDWCRD